MTPHPEGWGSDRLTKLIETARQNQFATFDNHPFMARLIVIDELVERGLKDAINPRPRLPMLFALRSHSAWRAAVSLTMGGQIHEAYPLYRSALEILAYGAYIGDDIALFKLWSSRSEGPEARKRVRDQFTHGNVNRFLNSMSKPIAGDYRELYERTIELGAHPNQLGFYGSLNVLKEGSDRRLQQIYLHGKGLQLNGAMLSGIQIGMWALHLSQLLWPARFELLGIREALEELRVDPVRMADAT